MGLTGRTLYAHFLASLAPILQQAGAALPAHFAEAARAAAKACSAETPAAKLNTVRPEPGHVRGSIPKDMHQPPKAELSPEMPLDSLPFRLIVDSRFDAPADSTLPTPTYKPPIGEASTVTAPPLASDGTAASLSPVALSDEPLTLPPLAKAHFRGATPTSIYQPLRVWVQLHPSLLQAAAAHASQPPPKCSGGAAGDGPRDSAVASPCSEPRGLWVPEGLASHEKRAQSGSKTTLDDCLRLFSAPERLGEQDTWFCPKCKGHVRATKSLTLWSTPPVLVVQLKRFAFSPGHRSRIDTLIDFPVRGLDLRPHLARHRAMALMPASSSSSSPSAATTDQNCMYDLFAVSEHMGGLGGGHYTAQVRSIADGVWYDCNDSSVRPAGHSGEGAVTSSAYMLFYRRRGSDAYLPPVPRTAAETKADVADGMLRRRQAADAAKQAKTSQHALSSAAAASEGTVEPCSAEPAPRTGRVMRRAEYATAVANREAELAARVASEEHNVVPAAAIVMGPEEPVGLGARLADDIVNSHTRSAVASAVVERQAAIDAALA